MFELTTDARAIVAAHADKAIPVVGTPPLNYSRNDAVYRSAKQACLALGFIEIDAECVARAWLAQSNRTRQFDPQAWPDEPADFGLRPWPRADAFPACPKALGVYAVLPTANWVGRMARAGLPTLQLRFKSEDTAAVQREVQAAVEAVRGTQALLFINDHWREAIAAGAYGVHLGQEDMEIADFAAIRAAGLRLGLSSHGYAEMVRADHLSPSYIAMGAVYPTTLKRMATAPQGPGRLAAYARLMRNYPGVGIGGISAAELPEIKATGVGSLAVVRAITAQNNPEQAAQDLMAAWAA
ncbi:MAG: thiamine phosphate synthase [Hylemonella sp.]|uniref:thiamine phosphate synthase n=1 Tax=Hylemonella sp. TaxID=2066020 RepID=UPI00391A6913